jgi:Ca2+-binding EF-hand superfamily protein
MKRVRIEEFFRDFDKLRKGKVTKGQFKTVFSQLNLDMTAVEYDSLFLKYKTNDPEDMFDYASFCANINSAFTTFGVQKDPNVRIKPVTQDNTVLARRKYLDASEEEVAQNDRLLDEYRTAINNKRLNLKPQFQDFDITRNGHVTKMQFMRVLAQLRISVPDELMNCLLKRYMDKGNVDEVNYVDFCNDIDSPVQVFGVGRDFNHSYNYYPKTQPKSVETDILKHKPQDIEDVIARIRSTCLQQRIRVAEFFRDFDKLRSGFITQAQFRIGLNRAKIVLSSQEFQQLCEYFNAPKEGGHVKWREFSDQVDEVFTKKNLEK